MDGIFCLFFFVTDEADEEEEEGEDFSEDGEQEGEDGDEDNQSDITEEADCQEIMDVEDDEDLQKALPNAVVSITHTNVNHNIAVDDAIAPKNITSLSTNVTSVSKNSKPEDAVNSASANQENSIPVPSKCPFSGPLNVVVSEADAGPVSRKRGQCPLLYYKTLSFLYFTL